MSIIDDARAFRAKIEAVAQYAPDDVAVDNPALYPLWDSGGIAYPVGFKLRHADKLYKVLQAHTSQADWSPDVAVSLFALIDETHSGDESDPIPYSSGMEIFSGKYYTEADVLYRCTRDSGQPLYHALSALVGLYVEIV